MSGNGIKKLMSVLADIQEKRNSERSVKEI